MEKTENYALNLYEANDTPNLLDGYNGSMAIIDDNLQRVDDAATDAIAESASAATSAKAAQSAVDSVKESVTELEHVVSDQETLINNNAADIKTEAKRAAAAEEVNSSAISTMQNTLSTIANAIKVYDASFCTNLDSDVERLSGTIIHNTIAGTVQIYAYISFKSTISTPRYQVKLCQLPFDLPVTSDVAMGATSILYKQTTSSDRSIVTIRDATLYEGKYLGIGNLDIALSGATPATFIINTCFTYRANTGINLTNAAQLISESAGADDSSFFA